MTIQTILHIIKPEQEVASNVVGTRYPTKIRSSSNVVGTRYPTKIRSGSNFPHLRMGPFRTEDEVMTNTVPGSFYFISDDYYNNFPDSHLMQNKETINGKPHGRPCFYAFKDPKTGLLWMIPISSQTQKFHKLEQQKIARYGKCETILFGRVLGHEKAFLIQNMCPISSQYITNQYADLASNVPVKVDGAFEATLVKTALQVLEKVRKGVRLVFPDVLAIEEKLLSAQKASA